MVRLIDFLSMGFSLLFMLVPLPLLFILLWKKRGYSINSFFSGVAIFIVFYLVLRYYLISLLFQGEGRGMVASLVVAVIIELGRYSGFSLLPDRVKSNLDIRVGLSLAAGYVISAFLLISAFNMAMTLVYAIALNGWGALGDFLSRYPQEKIDQVQLLILGTPPLAYLRETLFLYLSVPPQLLLSLFVFESFRRQQRKQGGILFLVLAVVVNGFYFYFGGLVGSLSPWVQLIYLAITASLSVLVMGRFWFGEMKK